MQDALAVTDELVRGWGGGGRGPSDGQGIRAGECGAGRPRQLQLQLQSLGDPYNCDPCQFKFGD